MDDILKDIAVGARVFRRSPGLAAGVAITIGLGVGASLAIFGLLHDTLIGQSPFRDPGRLVVIENTGRYYYGGSIAEGLAIPEISAPDYADIENEIRTLGAMGAIDHSSAVMTGGDRPRPIWRTLVSARVFPLLGARPRLGRLLDPGDFKPGAAPAAVLTESMWRRHFGSDPTVIGKAIRIDDQPFTVVGVAPDTVLRSLGQPSGLLDQWVDRQVISPLLASMVGQYARVFKFVQGQRDAGAFSVVGRLAPGRTLEQAKSEVSIISGRLAAQYPATNGKRGLQVSSLDEWRTTKVRGTTLMLVVAALLVFLAASCNAAGLILAESVRREAEIAVRQALGAGPARLIRLEFLRAILLALPGGLLAVALAAITLLVVDRTVGGGSGTIVRTLFVPRVMLAGAAITVISGLIAGAGVAWSNRRRGLAEVLKEGSLTASAGRRRQIATRTLVAIQVAAATSLVLGAGLMIRSVWNIVGVDLGFDVHHSLVMQVRLPPSRYPAGKDQRAFLQRALGRVRSLPGVVAAGAAIAPPLTSTVQSWSGVDIETPGAQKQTPESLNSQSVMPGYLEALDMKLVRGRWFTDTDYSSGQTAVLVDQAFCRKYLRGVDPLQAGLRFGETLVPIIGVVGDVRSFGPLSKPQDTFYRLEAFQRPAQWSYLVIRTAGNPAEHAAAILREVRAVDQAAATEDPQTVYELFARTFATRRRLLVLLGSAAAVVLLLTAFSLASAFAQFVAGRRREIAIRLALGAEGRHVTALLGRHIAIALAIGVAAGGAGGLALGRMLSKELFGITPADPLTFIETLVALVVLASLAALGPLWRASRVNPATTLRAQ